MALRLRLALSVFSFSNSIKRVPMKSLVRSFNKKSTETIDKSESSMEDELDQPIKYSTSPAADWAARHSFQGERDDETPWYQPHVITVSCLTFMLYFFYLREANDIDAMLDLELGDHFDVDNNELKKTLISPESGPKGSPLPFKQ